MVGKLQLVPVPGAQGCGVGNRATSSEPGGVSGTVGPEWQGRVFDQTKGLGAHTEPAGSPYGTQSD